MHFLKDLAANWRATNDTNLINYFSHYYDFLLVYAFISLCITDEYVLKV